MSHFGIGGSNKAGAVLFGNSVYFCWVFLSQWKKKVLQIQPLLLILK
jgi:hypothetical protein